MALTPWNYDKKTTTVIENLVVNQKSNCTVDAHTFLYNHGCNIWNYGSYVYIAPGFFDKYSDYIYNTGSYVTINCGYGDDTVNNTGMYATIYGGNGTDRISLTSSASDNLILYYAGDGNDIINGFNSTSTLQIGNGNGTYSRQIIGSDIIVKVDNYKVTLVGAATLPYVNIIGNEYIWNEAGNAVINTGNGNEYIYNTGTRTTVISGDGANTVINTRRSEDYSFAGAYAYIDAGNGNDYIENLPWCDYSTVIGGEGDDTITGTSSATQFWGGGGNDLIHCYGCSHNLLSGDGGNDYINNSGHNSTIYGGDGSDTIINTNAGEAHTLAGSYAYIDGGNGNDYIEENYGWCDWSTINGGSGDDTISDALWYTSIMGGAGNDLIFIWGGEYKTISGDSGSDTIDIRGFHSYVNGDSDNDSIQNFGTCNTLIGGDGSDTIINTRHADELTLAGSYAYIDGGNGNDYIENQGWCDWSTINGGAGDDTIVNANWNDLIDGGAGNDLINTGGRLHTIIGGTGNDTITNDKDDGDYVTFQYNAGDGYDVIYGFNETSTLQIGGGTASYSKETIGSDISVTVGDGSITLKGAAELETLNIAGTEKKLVPLKIKKYTNSSSSKVTLSSTYDVADATTRTKAIRIVGNAKDNSILGGSKNDTLYGKDGNDYLVGNAGSDKLYGQDGDDTLWGGTGNDTLIGGDGDDLFIHSAGKDLIYDYATGDRISLNSAISKATVSGSNVVLTIGNGTLTIKGGKNKTLSLITSTGAELETIISSDKVIYTDSSAAKVTLGSATDIGDASARTKAVRIVGNAKDNSILGGSGKDTLYGKDGDDYLVGGAGADKLNGYTGNDTLWGGTGNDTLIGGAGTDTFVYNAGDGKDVITDFIAKDDMLQITGTFSAKYYSSSDKIVFKVGSTASALTLKDISVTSATTFNINGDTYKISGTKLVKK